MDLSHAVVGSTSLIFGWWVRGVFVQKKDPLPCVCQCNCKVQSGGGESEAWFPTGLLLAIVLGLAGILANVALAFRVTLTNKGDQQELSFVLSQQKGTGKSKGVFGPAKGLQITG